MSERSGVPVSRVPAAASDAAGAIAPLAAEEARLLACVHCGLCLDVCPTYTRLGDEADSPRGRIYLMRAVAEGRIAPDDPAFHTHMDRCLGCRACEPVCPSGVQYGILLERARAVIRRTAEPGAMDRALLATFGSRWRTRLAGIAGRVLRAGGLARWLVRIWPERWRRTRFALAMLVATRRHALDSGTSRGAARGSGVRTAASASSRPGQRVATLDGCVQRALFAHVNAATKRVLRVNGFGLAHARGQGCCGALHAHAGELDRARTLALANIAAFENANADLVVVNAAGCGAMMKEYGVLFEGTAHADRAAAFAARVRDVHELLAERGPVAGAPIDERLAYDAPCHLVHGQRLADEPLAVLTAAIPGLRIAPVANTAECCGGAGTYGLTHAELGGRILDDKIEAVRNAGADLIVTANPGCIMQIGAGLVLSGRSLPVLHPIELLDESYRRAGLPLD